MVWQHNIGGRFLAATVVAFYYDKQWDLKNVILELGITEIL